MPRSSLLGSLTVIILVASTLWSAEEPDAAAIKFFDDEVKPILAQHCFKCHGPGDKIKGGLRLTSRDSILKGGETGPAAALDDPQQSLLLTAVNYDELEMPPGGKLPQAKIDALAKWVKLGLPMSEIKAEDHSNESGPPPVNEETKKFWSFQPVKKPAAPEVAGKSWLRNPIDAFILKELEEAGLHPASPASKAALIRRAYYDLTGLPPSPEAVQDFLVDETPEAFERVVDQLLESPHYGERWARHWLDLVRYAESNSYERDGTKPHVWRYRDYVIHSLNEDKPYDQFVMEQLAGDELDEVTADSIIATGYYRLGIWQDEPVDPEQELFEDLDDHVRTTAEVFLGLTVGCARCHDHKLDPIPQRDYYRMVAFFRNIIRYGVRGHDTVLRASVRSIDSEEQTRRHHDAVEKHKSDTKENRQALNRLDNKIKKDLKGVENDEWKSEGRRIDLAKTRIGGLLTQEEFDRYVALTNRRDELRRFRPPGLGEALCVKEYGRDAPPTHVLARGNAHAPGEAVQPGFLSVLSPPEPKVVPLNEGIASSGRRLALAKWITSKDNPMTSRVMVNRLWHYHFGRGIVRSTSDFGFQGSPPTHPQLLDWLAADFVASGWKLKRLHKLIMLSNTYQMSAEASADALAKDPLNDLFWRFDMRRLSAEEVRDSILAVNGSLNHGKMFGPSIFVKIAPEILAGQSRPGADWGNSSPEDRARRSIYIHVKRSLVVPMIANFDGADTDASCPVRFVTTQPTQALGMMNSEFVNEQAAIFAKSLREQAGDDVRIAVAIGLARTLQRTPTDQETLRGLELITKLQDKYELSPQDALKQFCVTLLNLNEFMYLD